MSTPAASVTAGYNIARRGEAYGMLYKTVDGNDVEAMHDQVQASIAMVRKVVRRCCWNAGRGDERT